MKLKQEKLTRLMISSRQNNMKKSVEVHIMVTHDNGESLRFAGTGTTLKIAHEKASQNARDWIALEKSKGDQRLKIFSDLVKEVCK